MRTKIIRLGRLLAAALPAALMPVAAGAEPAAFDTPEAAVAAVIAALDARDRDALIDVFGPENEDVIFSGDSARDHADWSEFLAAYNEMNRIAVEGEGEDTHAVLFIGTDQWPVPIEIDRGADGLWRFDAAAAREEILVRRIGENELEVMDLLRGYRRVQAAYRQIDYDADGVMEFAGSILSDPGTRNGLYWPPEPGTPESPIGSFMATAAAQGYSIEGEVNDPEPYYGYYFKILTRQGDEAPGGARDYLAGEDMVGGHAMLAFPAAPGESGIMSFLIGENGVLYEADLGDDTLAVASSIDAYNPGDPWTPVE